MDEAVHFYTQQVGFTLEVRHDWGFSVLKMDEQTRLGLMLESVWDREYPDNEDLPRPRVAIQTDDFDGEMTKLKQHGVPVGTINGEPGERRWVTFYDHDENPFFLWTDPEEPLN